MNEEQKKWVNNHIETMKKQIESKGNNLTDDEWQKVLEYVANCVKQAKSFGSEVREMLFDFIEQYDK